MLQVATGTTHWNLGLGYKRPPLFMTLLKLVQNLGIASYLHASRSRVIMKPQEILRFVQSAQQRGQSIDAGTFRDCLVGLEPI